MAEFIGDIALTLYCEVTEPVLLGAGSPFFYSKFEMGDCVPGKVVETLTDPEKLDAFLLGQRRLVANITGVPVENVRLISKKEYLEKAGPETESVTVDEDDDAEDAVSG